MFDRIPNELSKRKAANRRRHKEWRAYHYPKARASRTHPEAPRPIEVRKNDGSTDFTIDFDMY